MDFYTLRCIGQIFNEDDGSWDKGMIKLYDNFTNDYLYANQQYFSLLQKIMIPIVVKFITMIFENTKWLWLYSQPFAEFLNYYGSEIGMSGVRKKAMQTFD
jgi:hypothetical protein